MISIMSTMFEIHDEVKPTEFPDGSSQVWKIPNFEAYLADPNTTIIWGFESDAEIISIAQLTRLLPNKVVQCPYLPYGRQDKEVSNDKTFGLEVFMRILSVCPIKSFITVDAHSEVAEKFAKIYGVNFVNLSPKHFIQKAIEDFQPDYVAFPDFSAKDRYKNCIGALPVLAFYKVRDQATGLIDKMSLFDDIDADALKGKKVLIVDDIICGGLTPCMCSKTLKSMGATVRAYASHPLLTKGMEPLTEAGIDHVYGSYGEPIDE